MMDPAGDPDREAQSFWVFGYGSLMWDPGFPHVERRLAHVVGYERRFCLWSIRYRGTPGAPGLVLGLDATPDGSCTGIAFRVAPGSIGETRAYLEEREMVSYAYREVLLPVVLLDENGASGGPVDALTYVMDPSHPQYAAGLSDQECAEVIAASSGARGANREYLDRTLAQLAELELREPGLERIARKVATICGDDMNAQSLSL